jgi:hypothetical protein
VLRAAVRNHEYRPGAPVQQPVGAIANTFRMFEPDQPTSFD